MVLHERFPFVECEPAREEDVLRCHSVALLERVRGARGWLDRRHDLHRDDLRGGAARSRSGDRGGVPGRLRARASAGPSRRARSGDGVLHLRLGRRRRPLRPGRARPRNAWRFSTGTSITGTARRRSSATTPRSCSCRCTSGRSTPAPAGRTTRATRSSTSRSPAGTGDEAYLAAFERAERAIEAFEPELLLVSAGFDAHAARPACRARALDGGLRRARSACLPPGAPPRRVCSKAATTSTRCPTSWRVRSKGSAGRLPSSRSTRRETYRLNRSDAAHAHLTEWGQRRCVCAPAGPSPVPPR